MAQTEASQDQGAQDTVTLAHRAFREARDLSSEWRNQSHEWYAMVAGDQWDAETIFKLQDQQRPAVTFNRILRTINAVTGTQIANRQETRYLPRELGDVRVNEILTAGAEWARDNCDAEDEESDSFRDMTTCGMGWTETRMDYTSDPDGDIRIERIDPLEMYWDPGARKRNLSDARWVMHVRVMSRDEFSERWPDADLDLAAAPWEGAEDNTSQRVHVYPQDAYREEQLKRGGPQGLRPVRVAHFQWSVSEKQYRVGKRAERVSAAGFERLRAKLDARGIDYMSQATVRWKRAFIAGGALLEEGDSPYPDGPTFRCMTAERDRNNGTWFGLVKAMVDPQRFGNKFFSQILDILNKGSKGGIMAESDAVEDWRELEQNWARPDAAIKMRPGALSGGKIKEKPLVKMPEGLAELMAFSLDAVHETPGISLEFLGAADRNQPGVLEETRKRAGLTILAPLFDALRRYRKEQGRVLLYFIQKYLSDGRLIRIIGKQGNEKYVPLSKQRATAKYDVIVDESPTSPNMKERVYGALVQMLPALAKMGIPLPPELLDYAPIPASLAQKWKEQISQGQEIPPEIQQQIQKLTEENQALKDKRQESMAELQMKAQEQQAELQLKGQEQQQEMELAEAEHRAKMEQMEREFQLRAAEIQHKMQLAEMALAAKLQTDKAKAQADIVGDIARDETGMADLSALRRLLIGDEQPKRRHLNVIRNADDLIVSVDIVDMPVQGNA